MSSTCEWKIHFGTGQEMTALCDKERGHLGVDAEHSGEGMVPGQRITWLAGDRREYTGEWPGLCPDQPCILHDGHHGRHAP